MMVSKSVALTQAMQKMKLTEYRIFLYALSKINPFNVEKAKEELYISLSDFKDMFPTKNRDIKCITKAIEEAENRSVILQTGEALKVWKNITMDGDYIKVQFSEDILPHITNLKGGYVKYPLDEIRWYTSVPAIRLYEVLTQWAKKGEKTYTIAQLQSIMGVKYKNAQIFYKRCFCKACKDITAQGRFSITAERIYDNHRRLSEVLIHIAKNDLPLIPTKKAKAWENGEYPRIHGKRETKPDFFPSAHNVKKQTAEDTTIKEAVATITFKIGEWLDEKVVEPVAEAVQKVAYALPDITPEPAMPIPTPMPTMLAKTETITPTPAVSDIPAYVPDAYRKYFTSKEIAKILNVFDVRGVFEYLRGDILKQAWGIFYASKDDVKTPANYIAGTVRNLLTKMGIDMPNIFATDNIGTTAPVNTTAPVSKYPRKIEWQRRPIAKRCGYLDYEPNFDTDLFDYDAPLTCCTDAEKTRYSKEAKRRDKVKVADMVSQIPIDLYWRLTDDQIDKLCDYYENKGVSLEEMKTELKNTYETLEIENVPSNIINGEKILSKLLEVVQNQTTPYVAIEQPDDYSFANKY